MAESSVITGTYYHVVGRRRFNPAQGTRIRDFTITLPGRRDGETHDAVVLYVCKCTVANVKSYYDSFCYNNGAPAEMECPSNAEIYQVPFRSKGAMHTVFRTPDCVDKIYETFFTGNVPVGRNKTIHILKIPKSGDESSEALQALVFFRDDPFLIRTPSYDAFVGESIASTVSFGLIQSFNRGEIMRKARERPRNFCEEIDKIVFANTTSACWFELMLCVHFICFGEQLFNIMYALENLDDYQRTSFKTQLGRLPDATRNKFKMLFDLFQPLFEFYAYCRTLEAPRFIDVKELKLLVVYNPLMDCSRATDAQEDAVDLGTQLFDRLLEFDLIVGTLIRGMGTQDLMDIFRRREFSVNENSEIYLRVRHHCSRCGRANVNSPYTVNRAFWFHPLAGGPITNKTEWSLALSSLWALGDGNGICSGCLSQIKLSDILTFDMARLRTGHRLLYNVYYRGVGERYYMPGDKFVFFRNVLEVKFVVLNHTNNPASRVLSGHYTGVLNENGNLHFINDAYPVLPIENIETVTRFAYQIVLEVIGPATRDEIDTLAPRVADRQRNDHLSISTTALAESLDRIDPTMEELRNLVTELESNPSAARRDEGVDNAQQIMSRIEEARIELQRLLSDVGDNAEISSQIDVLNQRMEILDTQVNVLFASLF